MRRRKRAAVDTNLLLLVMCASLRRDPSRDGRLSRYGACDITLIQQVLESFDGLVTTPNLIAEVTTMLKGYDEYMWLTELLSTSCEVYIPNQALSRHEALPVFGFTDLGFLSQEIDDCCVITDDVKLGALLRAYEREVLVYSECREELLDREDH
jgi:hypothetical protein